jgi:hypothetical protein
MDCNKILNKNKRKIIKIVNNWKIKGTKRIKAKIKIKTKVQKHHKHLRSKTLATTQ